MPIDDEAKAIDEVVQRIESKFPDVPREQVKERVDAAVTELDGSTVRDFVPVLVEHKVADEMRQHSDER